MSFATQLIDAHVPEDSPALLPACEPIVRLWLLRMLVPLRLQRKLLQGDRFSDPALAEALGLPFDDMGPSDPDAPADRGPIVRALVRQHAAAEAQAGSTGFPPVLAANLQRLGDLMEMSACDRQILGFAVLLSADRLLDDAADGFGPLALPQAVCVLALVLQQPVADVRLALQTNGLLMRSGLIQNEGQGSSVLRNRLHLLSGRFADHMLLAPMNPVDLFQSVLDQPKGTELSLADFSHIRAQTDVTLSYLSRCLEQRRTGVNLLIYGGPGTGKTQLTRVLAKALDCALFEVSAKDEDGDPIRGFRRLCALRAGQALLRRSRALIVFDELEDVSGSFDAPHDVARSSKAWFNRMLEENAVPTAWISNDISELDPAFVRRFDQVIELAVPSRHERLRIIQQRCGTWLNIGQANMLAASKLVTPAVLDRAASVTEIVCDRAGGGTDAANVLNGLIQSTLRAQGHSGLDDNLDLPDLYDPHFVNTQADLDAIAHGLQRAGSACICLYGPPGTGKSAWAVWLAQQLNRPLQVERASDLLSRYVGGTERNLSRSFRLAQTEKSVLLMDEVDSLLQDRAHMQERWLLSQVNEFLIQMEQFRGIFVATTNRVDQLDPASMRRFDLKVKFDYLRPHQAVALFGKYCNQLNVEPTDEQRERLAMLSQLTPGDFRMLARRSQFQPYTSAGQMVDALIAECAFKQPAQRGMGFLQTANTCPIGGLHG